LDKFESVGVTYWFTDTHKWFFSPKGSAILWVSRNKQDSVYPSIDCATIGSKGCTVIQNKNNDLTHFEKRFMYLGTKDYTPWLSIGSAIDFIESNGGYKHIIDRNRNLALNVQRRISKELNTSFIHDSITASMCNIRIPFITTQEESRKFVEYLTEKDTYVVVGEYPSGCFWLRLCIQLFIDEKNVDRLIETITEYCSA